MKTKSALIPLSNFIRSTAESMKSATETSASIYAAPNIIECKHCSKVIKSVKSSTAGDWYYPNFNMHNRLCRRCEKIENIEKHLEIAGVPPKYYNSTFESFNVNNFNRKTYDFCKNYTLQKKFDIGLFLFGPCGVGKTHLAISVIREMLLNNRNVFFISTPNLLFQLRKTFSTSVTTTDEEQLRKYLSYSFLVLDDLGTEKWSEWVQQTLDHIVYQRDAHAMPAIITSNLALNQIQSRYGDRIVSRITGMSHVLKLTGADHRLAQRKKL